VGANWGSGPVARQHKPWAKKANSRIDSFLNTSLEVCVVSYLFIIGQVSSGVGAPDLSDAFEGSLVAESK
jgi:hypothetical protein